MGTWCATYVSNIQATIVHPVDLQVSLKYFMTVIMLILKCMCIMTVQLCSNTYTHFWSCAMYEQFSTYDSLIFGSWE